jgi:SAM-dependent methyltransferase
MLHEHLCQDHDAASRPFEKIDQQVRWIHRALLCEQSTRILDLCCGPGLYTTRLARVGHACVGIDYSPASIAYALNQSKKEKLDCSYVQKDIRTAGYGSQFGLAMLIFGEFNVFAPQDAKQILKKILAALAQNGLLLLEVHTFNAVKEKGEENHTWQSFEQGLFSDKPYLFLEESFWEPQGKTTTKRYYIIDASTGKVRCHAQSLQAYSKSKYRSILEDHGFVDVEFFPSLIGEEDESQNDFIVIVARKEAGK